MKYSTTTHPVIAIDLDDTIWSATTTGTHIFPNAGVPYQNAIKTINRMIAEGYEVIIWTARDSENQAKECKKALLDAGINPNFKWNYYSNHANSEYVINKASSRKIDANVFFDDRAFGAPVYNEETWETIYNEFFPKENTFPKDRYKLTPKTFVGKPNPNIKITYEDQLQEELKNSLGLTLDDDLLASVSYGETDLFDAVSNQTKRNQKRNHELNKTYGPQLKPLTPQEFYNMLRGIYGH